MQNMIDKSFLSDHWRNQLPELRNKLLNAKPFPHIVCDNFLRTEVAEQLFSEFPKPNTKEWDYYAHFNTKKWANKDFDSFGPTTKAVVNELNSPDFIKSLSEMSGIDGLFPDTKLEGGGLHQIQKGGYLNIHADFTVHPHHLNWRRRLNLILYLNKNWKDEYGGALELWEKDMKTCAAKVLPVFNRAVLFMTNDDAFHGFPEPLSCPETESRKSLALYYFTPHDNPEVKSTNFQARPQDSKIKAARIYFTQQLSSFYDVLKRRFGFSDKFATRILKFLNRRGRN